jgi:hypothetical protein
LLRNLGKTDLHIMEMVVGTESAESLPVTALGDGSARQLPPAAHA